MRTNSLNDVNFQGLYVTPETLKKIGCTKKILLNNPSIKNCADKYDVLITAGTRKYVINRRDGFTKDKYLPSAYLAATALSAPYIPEWLVQLGITNLETVAAVCFGIMTFAGLSIVKLLAKNITEMNVQGISNIEKVEKDPSKSIYMDEYRMNGAKTDVYAAKRNAYGVIENLPDMAKLIREKEYKTFYNSVLKDTDLTEIETPQKYLEKLQEIQKKASAAKIKDVFAFPINKGGDTLLTKFFDIPIPDKNDFEGMETYYKILQQIAKTDKANFNQKDSNGTAILEKILRSENEFILPMIRGAKFSYSPYLESAYKGIHNELFKNQLNLLIDFNFELLEK